ncbi:YqjF family protein [Mucilaginibacter terrae]|uniref:YqjF family protein n=1 Tax=Mucilaginibacter terrae TaxID=1955052 RepID=UPI00362F4D69
MPKIKFLQAEWRDLLMINYEVDPEVLKPYLPAYTELDLWQGKALVSMVGFMFLNTKVLGVKWPFHVNFEEVNLRFYVRYFNGKEWKRGAVFISEIVPKLIIPLVANNLYNEHYKALPMRHSVKLLPNQQSEYLYEWKYNGWWNKLGATVSDAYTPMQTGSAEQFIFEHYWGYNSINASTTLEYAVEHPSWEIALVTNPVFEAEVGMLYGKTLEPYLKQPFSAFFAKGSAVAVRVAQKIRKGSD